MHRFIREYLLSPGIALGFALSLFSQPILGSRLITALLLGTSIQNALLIIQRLRRIHNQNAEQDNPSSERPLLAVEYSDEAQAALPPQIREQLSVILQNLSQLPDFQVAIGPLRIELVSPVTFPRERPFETIAQDQERETPFATAAPAA